MKKEIYLAGGCFWGTEKYFADINGVTFTEVGYANGKTENPTYEEVCQKDTGHAETVRIEYDDTIVTLSFILSMYYEVIDPTTLNRQGGDTGRQYRTGIYYVEEKDEEIIEHSIAELQKKYTKKIQIEVHHIENYFKAEEYHQNYLNKNPSGYCHIGKDKFEAAKVAIDITKMNSKYEKKTKEEVKKILTSEQFNVTQNQGTELPYENAYFDVFKQGIYVDITTGEPLFISSDKFESGCGWPSFSKPISNQLIEERFDGTHGRERTEVRSKNGDIHLGHVFEDGPKESGGLRYCINSASLKFITKEKMEEKGYGDFLFLFKNKK